MWEVVSRGSFPYPDLGDAEVIGVVCHHHQHLLQPVECPDNMWVLTSLLNSSTAGSQNRNGPSTRVYLQTMHACPQLIVFQPVHTYAHTSDTTMSCWSAGVAIPRRGPRWLPCTSYLSPASSLRDKPHPHSWFIAQSRTHSTAHFTWCTKYCSLIDSYLYIRMRRMNLIG